MTKYLLAAFALALVALVPTAPAADTTKPAELLTDARFAMMAASGDMFEIESSKLALTKSKDEHTQKMAKQMIADHEKAGAELKKLCADKNVELPAKMDKTHQAMYDNLTKADDFDKAYVKAQVAAHEQAVSLYKSQAASGKDADMKDFATKTLPVIVAHLDHFQKMAKGAKVD